LSKTCTRALAGLLDGCSSRTARSVTKQTVFKPSSCMDSPTTNQQTNSSEPSAKTNQPPQITNDKNRQPTADSRHYVKPSLSTNSNRTPSPSPSCIITHQASLMSNIDNDKVSTANLTRSATPSWGVAPTTNKSNQHDPPASALVTVTNTPQSTVHSQQSQHTNIIIDDDDDDDDNDDPLKLSQYVTTDIRSQESTMDQP
jgi:hypothetical protein